MAPKSKSTEAKEELFDHLHPKWSEQIIGHESQERQILDLINQKRLPHAILLSGEKGIGKATFAYRLAKYLLSPAAPAGDSLFGDALLPESLYVQSNSPTARKIILGSHPDMLVVESATIKIEEAREVTQFLSLTPAESDWRVVIIDGAEAMNTNAANALLKTLEEPPAQALIILVSHNHGALLPTIRSRCVNLRFLPLQEQHFAQILGRCVPHIDPKIYHVWAVLSGFSPGMAVTLIQAQADILYKELCVLITQPNTQKWHQFADRFARKESEQEWKTLAYLLQKCISRISLVPYGEISEIFVQEEEILRYLHQQKPPEYWSDWWEQVQIMIHDVDRIYLDKKQTLLTILHGFV